MEAYVLTWNPAKWQWADLAAAIEVTRNGALYKCQWSTGNTRRIRPGGRLYLLRQGVEPRGIMAAGIATSRVEHVQHHNPAQAAQGQMANRVWVEFDRIVEPGGEGFLHRQTLVERVPDAVANWRPAASGMSLSIEEAYLVEQFWCQG